MYASTGGRPVNSPFQTLAWVDFKRKIIFLEDKVSGPTRSARICALSDISLKLLRELYLPHLLALSKYLEPSVGEFAREILRVASSDPDAAVPLFFFLKEVPDLDWIEVTETQIALESCISWPLPWNLFRHIHATELVRRGLSPEVVDALLGHGDRTVESHGDFSLRIPENDIETARPIVNALQSELMFTPPLPLIHFPARMQEAPRSLIAGRQYGRSARRAQRTQSQEAARKRARREIEHAIGRRPVETLSPETWQEIARSMLIRKDGLPHSAASLRYEEFEGFVESLWHDQRKLTRIRRIYSVAPEPVSLFNEDCVGAPEIMGKVIAEYERVVASLANSSINIKLAATLAALELILYSKVSNFATVKSIALSQPSVQIVKFQKKFWLEWTDAEIWRNGRPVLRVQITARLARWSTASQLSARRQNKFPSVPKPLLALSQILGSGEDLQRLLRRLCVIQDQMNSWQMAGIDAAHLNGHLVHSALPHADWYRATTLKAPLISEPSDETESESDADTYSIEGHYKVTQSNASQSTPESCAVLFDQIQTILRKEGANVETKRGAVTELLRKSAYGRGDMPFIFAQFLLNLMARKPKKGARDGLRLETIERYFNSLNRPLCDTAHDICLTELDGDEITDLYCRMLEWWDDHYIGTPTGSNKKEPTNPRDGATVDDGEGQTMRSVVSEYDDEDANSATETKARTAAKLRLTPQQRAEDAARRTLSQLRELHAFAAKNVGVEEPDWSEITNGNVGTIGRPGFVLLSEYKLALTSLLSDRDVGSLPDPDLAVCVSLFVCARFGVRVGEAVGLYKTDWVEFEGAIVLLVRANPMRTLKTVNSRRQIPLIGRLDATERQLIDEVIRRSQHSVVIDQSGPLLPGVSRKTFKSRKHEIGDAICNVLKAVTCNPFCTAHMLRHSFATRVLAVLRGFEISVNEPVNASETRQLRRLLLGTEQLDRRTMWAVCRLLGHKNPRITARCYLHAMQPASKMTLETGSWDGTGIGMDKLLNLDSVDTAESYGCAVKLLQVASTIHESQLLCLLKCWRLISQGYDTEPAIRASQVRKDIFEKFISLSDFLKEEESKSEDSSVSELVASSLPFWRISLVRIGSLISHLTTVGPLEKFDVPDLAIRETIGAKRQIVLFMQEHFIAADRFPKDLKLTSSDVVMAKTKFLLEDHKQWISKFGLNSFLATEGILPADFRVDRATTGSQKFSVTHRVSLIPNSAHNVIKNTFELMFLWLGWYVCMKNGSDSKTETLPLPLN
jgi:integrase